MHIASHSKNASHAEPASGRLYRSPSHLSESARAAIAAELNHRLADGIDLHSQIKVAHWNIRGPQFAALHPLFDSFATELAGYIDAIAERAVTLGGVAHGTVRQAAAVSALPDYPASTSRDIEHACALLSRFELYLDGLRSTRERADALDDPDTVDLLTAIVLAFEKHAWFLRATADT